jgi:hypothetical protein
MSKRRKDMSERIYHIVDLTDADLARGAASLIEDQQLGRRNHIETRLMMTIIMQEVERRRMLGPAQPVRKAAKVVKEDVEKMGRGGGVVGHDITNLKKES